jgi:hypothetical protein
MDERLAERIAANVWKVIKGHYGSWLGAAAIGALITISVLAGALLLPGWRSIAALVALGYLAVTALIVVALLARSGGHLLDLAANVSLQAHLLRSGFPATDFFVDGAAASPTLQLVLAKVLTLCRPTTVLELGSGQTTKLLAHYARSRPEVQILTIEENSEWHRHLSATLGPPANHQYCASRLEPKEVTLPNGRGMVSTAWYSQGEALLAGREFQLILVDGPTNSRRGDEFVRYSRSGLIPHLPALLASSFVILIDDTDNYGYFLTARSMRESLVAHGRAVYAFEVHGVKSQTILCSPDWQFLRSV